MFARLQFYPETSFRQQCERSFWKFDRYVSFWTNFKIASDKKVKQNCFDLLESESVPNAHPWSQTKGYVSHVIKSYLLLIKSLRIEFFRIRKVLWIMVKGVRWEPDVVTWFQSERFSTWQTWRKFEFALAQPVNNIFVQNSKTIFCVISIFNSQFSPTYQNIEQEDAS